MMYTVPRPSTTSTVRGSSCYLNNLQTQRIYHHTGHYHQQQFFMSLYIVYIMLAQNTISLLSFIESLDRLYLIILLLHKTICCYTLHSMSHANMYTCIYYYVTCHYKYEVNFFLLLIKYNYYNDFLIFFMVIVIFMCMYISKCNTVDSR